MKTELRIYNQDCIEGCRAHVPDGTVDLVITDPPYGIDGHTLHKHYNRKEDFVVDGYVEVPREEYPAFSRQWIREMERILRRGGSAYVFSGWTNLHDLLNAIAETSLEIRNHIIWKYNFGVFTRKKFVTSHYHILYLVKPGGQVTFNRFCRYGSSEKAANGGSLQYQDMEDVWIVNREYKPGRQKNKNELPTGLLTKMIQYSSNPRDTVCDLFLGGFSTARVARGMRRSVIGFEINPTDFPKRLKSVKQVKPGELLKKLKTGKADEPENIRKPWSPEEDRRLKTLYLRYRSEGMLVRDTIARLCKELGRGRFALDKALRRLGVLPERRRKKSEDPLLF